MQNGKDVQSEGGELKEICEEEKKAKEGNKNHVSF